MFSGGDLLEISYKHSEVGSGTWFPKSSEDGSLDPGGYRKADDANSVTGDGQPIRQMNRVLGSFETVVAWDMQLSNELDQARKLASNPNDADFTFTHINGTIWGGKGTVVGDIVGNTNTATMSVKISCPLITKIS